MNFFDGFNKVYFTKATFPQRFDDNVVVDLLKHSFGPFVDKINGM